MSRRTLSELRAGPSRTPTREVYVQENQDKFSEEIFNEILEKLAVNDFGLFDVLDSDPVRYPIETVFYKWLNESEDRLRAYRTAREIQGLRQGDKAVWEGLETDPTKAGIARLRFDARRWHASKLAPKVYGDATQIRLANASGDGDATLRLEKAPLVDELASLLNITPQAKKIEAGSK